MPIVSVVKGNLIDRALEGHYSAIIHGCNIFHTFGSGIAKEIRERLPEAYEADCEKSAKGDEGKMGSWTTALITHKGEKLDEYPIVFLVVNAYTQASFGKSGVHVDYDAIEQVFFRINEHITGTLAPEEVLKYRIGIPLIGAGLGGGDWEKIKEIINTSAPDLQIEVVELDTTV